MATRRSAPRSNPRSSRSGGSFFPFVLGVVFVLAILAAGWAYLQYGHPPASIRRSAAAITSPASPSSAASISTRPHPQPNPPRLTHPQPATQPAPQMGTQMGTQPGTQTGTQPGTHTATQPHSSPLTSQKLQQPPFGISEDVFESGARVYAVHCAACHGIPGRDSIAGAGVAPAPQLFTPLLHSLGVGVSNLPPGETFARIQNGLHPPAMPAYRHTLTSTQIWQVSLLLKNAAQPLPDPVRQILHSAHSN